MVVDAYERSASKVADMLSQKAKYALRALLSLAEAPRGETVLISEIATRHRIPKKFLEQILLDLKNHGLVQSWRGRSGGYALLKPAGEISFGQVLRIIDGPLAPLPCVSGLAYRKCADCADEANCRLKRVFAKSHRATLAVLDRTTIADALTPDGLAGTVPLNAAPDADVVPAAPAVHPMPKERAGVG